MKNRIEQVQWGIIGCGDVTEAKSGPAFSKVSHSRLVAVMRRDAKLAEDYAKRHNVARWYADACELIDDAEVNAIYIATPPYRHKAYAIQAADAGKAVYVEKPMALNAAECAEMIAAAKANGTALFVAYYRRRLPRFLKIRELIESGDSIGIPRFVTCTLHRPLEERYRNPDKLPWTVVPSIAGGGLFVDLACHTLDMLDFLFGGITSVRGHASSQAGAYPAEDCVSMSFLFRSGVHGCGIWNFASYDRLDEVRIVGTEGQITFSTFGTGDIVVTRPGEPEQRYALDNPVHIQQPMIECVVKSLLDPTTLPVDLDPMHAARTSWVMDQVLDEYRRRHCGAMAAPQ
jgi:1,5-anhydro-D-fructose reductase (1,5-anhydro-D-mannitol-forming)